MRMLRSALVVALVVLAIPLSAGSAAAGGGSWLTPERPSYVPGEVASFGGRFWRGAYEGRIADGPYIGYLLPQDGWINHHVVPRSATRLGEIRIVRIDGHVLRGRLEFVVPDVPTGIYHVGYCNDPCTVDGIGDLVGGEQIAIGATRLEGLLLLRNQRLEWGIREAVARIRHRSRGEVKALEEALDRRAVDLQAADARVSEIASELAAARRTLQVERSRTSWAPAAGGLLLLGLALLVVVLVLARRLRRARIDAELHALTHKEAGVGERRLPSRP